MPNVIKGKLLDNLGDCLPTGPGVVTRCPLVIQLHTQKNEGDHKMVLTVQEHELKCPWNDTGRAQAREFINEHQIRLIQEAGAFVSEVEIKLRVESDLDLVLVDLPGLAAGVAENYQCEALLKKYV